jgi:hypothetical protein
MIHRILLVAAAVVAALLLGGGNALACHDGGIASGNEVNPDVTIAPAVTTGDVVTDVADVSTCGGVVGVLGSEQECGG